MCVLLLILRVKCWYLEIFIVVNRPYFVTHSVFYNLFKLSTVPLVAYGSRLTLLRPSIKHYFCQFVVRKNDNCDQKCSSKSPRIGTDQWSNTIEKKIKIACFFSYHEMLIQIRNISLILQKMLRIKLPSFHATVEIRIVREN